MIYIQRTTEPDILQQYGARWLAALQTTLQELDAVKNNPQATQQEIARAKKNKENAQKSMLILESRQLW